MTIVSPEAMIADAGLRKTTGSLGISAFISRACSA